MFAFCEENALLTFVCTHLSLVNVGRRKKILQADCVSRCRIAASVFCVLSWIGHEVDCSLNTLALPATQEWHEVDVCRISLIRLQRRNNGFA